MKLQSKFHCSLSSNIFKFISIFCQFFKQYKFLDFSQNILLKTFSIYSETIKAFNSVQIAEKLSHQLLLTFLSTLYYKSGIISNQFIILIASFSLMDLQEQLPPRPAYGKILAFDHITFWVGNAKQAASFYTSRFGFEYFAYKGLETGERGIASHVVKNAQGSVFVFCSVYQQDSNQQINHHLVKHGDGVRDVAFTVQDSKAVYDFAIKGGAKSVLAPTQLKDENGVVIISSVHTYGQTTHTFVERKNYKGLFMPGFVAHYLKESFNNVMSPIRFEKVDHIVGNQPDLQMQPAVKWYEQCLGFHRFWSVDDKMMHTEYSALRSIVVADYDENVKMPINEPAAGKKKSQIQQYVDYYHGAGVQHIALKTETIIETVQNLRSRGIEFLGIPDTYYDILRKNLPDMNIKVAQDIDVLQKNKILIDYDDKGYLLQIFTKPVEDRPTLFYEIIQRRNHQGFGAGNFKSLFVSIEEQQRRRGNLTDL